MGYNEMATNVMTKMEGKMKRIIIICITLILLSTGFVYAISSDGVFEGFPVVNVKINGETLKSDVPGVIIQGRTVLPARAISESLNAVVSWDQSTMTASINKPSAHIIFCESVTADKNGSWTMNDAGFGAIQSIGKDRWLYIYTEIGPMEKQLYKQRILIKDPQGEPIKTSEAQEHVIDNYGTMDTWYITDITFPIPGQYKVQLQVMFNGSYQSIGEAIIYVE